MAKSYRIYGVYLVGCDCIRLLFKIHVIHIVIQCPDLSDSIKNGKVVIIPTARTVNSTAEYSCNGDYKLDKGDAKHTCQDGGTWSGEAPQCSEYIVLHVV